MTSVFISITLDGVTSFFALKTNEIHVNASITVKVLGGISFHVMADWENLKDKLAFLPFFTVGKQDPWYLPAVYYVISVCSASERTCLRQIGKFFLLACFAKRTVVPGMPS